MRRAIPATLLALSVSACAGPSARDVLIPTFTYRPTATDLVTVVDSPADVRTCRRLGAVSPPVATGPGFDGAYQAMLDGTVGLGGTHLYLDRVSRDWATVRGIAYDCDPARVRRDVVIRAKG
jgi:hypothetical protein